MIKAVSVLLALLFSFGTTFCAFADEFPDLYGVNAAQRAPISQNIEPLELMSSGAENGFTLTAEKTGATGVRLKWSSDTVYLSYTLCCYNNISGAWDEVITTAKSGAKVKGLSEDTTYRFAVMNSADGTILGVTEVSTKKKKAEIVVKNISSKSVELKIKNAEKDALVEVYRSEDKKNYEKIGFAKNGRFTDLYVDGATEYFYKVKCYNIRNNKLVKARKSAVKRVVTLKPFALPADSDGTCKTYAIYTAVTAKSSPQYALLHSDKCYTDAETGIRMVDGFYCVALGSFYGSTIGTKYKITLADGENIKELNVILCDQKADRHTNSTHQYAMRNKDVVEFYVEKAALPASVRGDYSALPQFRGKIIAIEQYIEE